MAIDIENSADGSGAGSAAVCTLTITNADYIVGIASFRNFRTVSSFYWDNAGVQEALAELALFSSAGDSVAVYGLANPTPGASKVVRVNLSGDTCIVMGAIGLTTAELLYLIGSETNTDAANVIDGLIGGITFCGHAADGTLATTSQGGTELWNDIQSDATLESVRGGASYSLGGGSKTLGFLGANTDLNMSVTLGTYRTGGSHFWFSKIQDFYDELKRGLIAPELLQKRCKEVFI